MTCLQPVRLYGCAPKAYLSVWITFLGLFLILLLSFPVKPLLGQEGTEVFLLVCTCVLCFLFASRTCMFASLGAKDIRLTWLGIPVRRLPVRDLKFIGILEGQHENVLYFSTVPLDALAARREQHLLSNPITRQDVPFCKRKPDWQKNFARDYLNRFTLRALLPV